MKKLLVMIVFSIAILFESNAQNKTLGVGTTTPNQNAALHVESPTNNQGFIMPRLTTAQRTAMSAILTASDQGLMLFDTNLNTIFIWSGTAWKSTAEVAGGAKLAYPYKDSVTTNPPAGVFDVFALKYNGTVNSRVMRVESISPNNLSSALSVQQRGRGLAGFFEQFNDTTSSSALFARVKTNKVPGPNQLAPVAVYGESTGTHALGGAFWNLNAANNYPALYTRTKGTGSSAIFETENAANTAPVLQLISNGTGPALLTSGNIQAGQFIGDGSQLTNLPPIGLPFTSLTTNAPNNTRLFHLRTNSANNSDSVYVARFINENPNAYSDVLSVINMGKGAGAYFQVGDIVNNTGQGAAVFAAQNGLGRAGQFQITNVSNNQPALRSYTNGINRAAWFTIDNPANDLPAAFAQTNGVGPAVYGLNSGPGDTFSPAGHFVVNNATNTHAAVQGNNSGAGPAGRFLVENTSSGATALESNTDGVGPAASFTSTNSSNPTAGVHVNYNGTGTALQVDHTGTGTGLSVLSNDPANTNSIVQITNSGAGYSLDVSSTGTQRVAYFNYNNATSTAPGVSIASNALVDALEVYGLGAGRAASFYADNATSAEVVQVRTDGVTNRGLFALVNNNSSPHPAIEAQSTGTGPAISAIQSNNGTALEIVSGSVKYNVVTITPSVSTQITTRAGLYKVVPGGPTAITFNLSPLPADGEHFLVANVYGAPITVEGYTMAHNTIGHFVYLTGNGWLWIP